MVASVPGPQTAKPSAAATAPAPARRGLIDLHTHAIAPSLPDLAAVAPWAHWPSFDPFFDTAAELGALVLVHPADTTLDPRLATLGVAFGAGLPGETGVAVAGLLTGGALLRRRMVGL